MTDLELLELAAKAAGLRVGYWLGDEMQIHFFSGDPDESMEIDWNPLTDDGDALRLAVAVGMLDGGLALLINSQFGSTGFAQCHTNNRTVSPEEYMGNAPYAATRRAIVRAAAEIGKGMK